MLKINCPVYEKWAYEPILDNYHPNIKILWMLGMCFINSIMFSLDQYLELWVLFKQKIAATENTTLAAKCSSSLQLPISSS